MVRPAEVCAEGVQRCAQRCARLAPGSGPSAAAPARRLQKRGTSEEGRNRPEEARRRAWFEDAAWRPCSTHQT